MKKSEDGWKMSGRRCGILLGKLEIALLDIRRITEFAHILSL